MKLWGGKLYYFETDETPVLSKSWAYVLKSLQSLDLDWQHPFRNHSNTHPSSACCFLGVLSSQTPTWGSEFGPEQGCSLGALCPSWVSWAQLCPLGCLEAAGTSASGRESVGHRVCVSTGGILPTYSSSLKLALLFLKGRLHMCIFIHLCIHK